MDPDILPASRDDFTSDSNVDVLVEFLPGSVPGFFGLVKMERELAERQQNSALIFAIAF